MKEKLYIDKEYAQAIVDTYNSLNELEVKNHQNILCLAKAMSTLQKIVENVQKNIEEKSKEEQEKVSLSEEQESVETCLA